MLPARCAGFIADVAAFCRKAAEPTQAITLGVASSRAETPEMTLSGSPSTVASRRSAIPPTVYPAGPAIGARRPSGRILKSAAGSLSKRLRAAQARVRPTVKSVELRQRHLGT